MRKDIENMRLILIAIERIEKTGQANFETAERLDTLYSALKLQANEVYQNELLDNTTTQQ